MSEIKANSISEAVGVVYQNPEEFQFQNNWLIDYRHRITSFGHNGLQVVAKSSQLKKAHLEKERAEAANSLLVGKYIGGRAVVAAVPDLVLGTEKDECYLVSKFVDADMNESYYKQEQAALSFEDWADLFRLLMSKRIRYGDYLPRNTIITHEQIVLIDWENARFGSSESTPDRLDWTNLLIGWSYFYGIDSLKNFQTEIGISEDAEPKLIGYEKLFSGFIGNEINPNILRKSACDTAVAAEADRGYPKLPYKMDDAFHVISELIPDEVEVLMDILLASKNNLNHHIAAKLISSVLKSFHEVFLEGIADQDLEMFKQRCAKLLWLLINPELMYSNGNGVTELDFIDALRLPNNTNEIAENIFAALVTEYPDARPNRVALRRAAYSIRSLVK